MKPIKNKIRIFLFCCFLLQNTMLMAQQPVQQWDRFELTLHYQTTKNAFEDVKLTASFTDGDTSYVVAGFYDGEGTYKIRFMPTKLGKWSYITSSNVRQLDHQKGTFDCVPAKGDNHGMVKVSNTYHFAYADGKRYDPFGTTAYAWIHMGEELQEITLNTLQQSGFNKIRMCVFPKSYELVQEEPALYPFEVLRTEKDAQGREKPVWDFSQFNPKFFQHLEKRIDDLNRLGIEADLILFHPYDKGRWGFDSLDMNVNLRYIEYLMARLASFRNVWWSLANEWDYVKSKTVTDWNTIARAVHTGDPYGHLCSIHGSTATYFDYWRPEFTHVSIQDETPVQNPATVGILRRVYHKPIVCDEVGYEGNLKSRWGRYSPEEMTYLVLNGVMGGGYVTHGESYLFHDARDTIFWAKGGTFKGESWKRIAFLRKIVETSPHPLQLADISRDDKTTTAGKGYFFINLGKEIHRSWLFNLPAKNADYESVAPGTRFKVDVIDLWDMTVQEYPAIFEATETRDYRIYDKENQQVYLPEKPYILLRVEEIEN